MYRIVYSEIWKLVGAKSKALWLSNQFNEFAASGLVDTKDPTFVQTYRSAKA